MSSVGEPEIRLAHASTRVFVLTPIRLGLGLAGLGAAALVGRPGPVLLAFGVLTGIALFFDATLAALLSGVLAGMAASGFIAWINLDAIERRNDYRLYVERPESASSLPR